VEKLFFPMEKLFVEAPTADVLRSPQTFLVIC